MKKLKISIFYPIVIASFLLVAVGLLFVRSATIKHVQVIDEGKIYQVQTFKNNVDDVLNKLGVALSESDKVTPDFNAKVEDQMTIEISRSFTLTIRDGEEVREVTTTHHKVRDILNEQDIKIGELDIVAPFIDATIYKGAHINVTRVWDELVTEEVMVPYYTEINLTSDLDTGEVELVQNGENGLKEVTYQIRYENGKMMSRNYVNESILVAPVSEIKNKGSEEFFVTSRGLPFRYSKMIVCQATAYDLSYASCGKYPDHPAYGITFSGTKARPGVIAVDPKVIPLGSKVYIESKDYTKDYGFASAEDTGSAIKGNKVDLFIGDNKSALRYGRRYVNVYILDDTIDESYIKGYGY